MQPGARFIDTWSLAGYDNQLVFRNPNDGTVIVAQNDLGDDLPISFLIGDRMVAATLPADSFSTIVIPSALLETQGEHSPTAPSSQRHRTLLQKVMDAAAGRRFAGVLVPASSPAGGRARLLGVRRIGRGWASVAPVDNSGSQA